MDPYLLVQLFRYNSRYHELTKFQAVVLEKLVSAFGGLFPAISPSPQPWGQPKKNSWGGGGVWLHRWYQYNEYIDALIQMMKKPQNIAVIKRKILTRSWDPFVTNELRTVGCNQLVHGSHYHVRDSHLRSPASSEGFSVFQNKLRWQVGMCRL